MSVLTGGFKSDHSNIVAGLKEAKELGVLTKEGHAKAISIIVDLVTHLSQEDELLYPLLTKASKHNKKLKEILSVFVNGLGKIYEDALNLLTKYSIKHLNSDFHKEFDILFDTLSIRIECEENFLFDEYEKIAK